MLRYTSTLKEMPLLFTEMRKAAVLRCEGIDEKGIILLSESENIFQVDKERRKRELATRILTRVKTLSPELMTVLANGSLETSKAVALYALLNVDLLLFEFFREVYADKHYIGEHCIYDADIMSFYHRKADASPIVSAWKDNNLRQLKATYKKVLVESGFAKSKELCLEITPPLIEKSVIELLLEERRKAMCLS